jgi:hypothetical protein
MNSTLNTLPCRVRADAEFTAVPLRSAIRPRLPSTTGCGNPRPGSPGHAHWLPDSMPAPAMTVMPGDLRPPARPARRRPGSASRWPRHPPHRTHSHSPPRRHAPPPGQDAPAQANSPPRQLTPATAHAAPGPDGTPLQADDHEHGSQKPGSKSPSPPPGASGPKYLSSSRTAAPSFCFAA